MVGANRVVLEGGIGGGNDRWSTSCAFGGNGSTLVDDPADLQTWAAAISTGLATWTGTAIEGISGTNTTIDGVSVYYYPDVTGPAAATGQSVVAWAGTGTNIHPLPTSMVFSLGTGLAGRSYRGRMYWPAIAASVSSGGYFSTTLVGDVADDVVDLLAGIAGVVPGPGPIFPVVVSKTGGFVTGVTTVRVGTVPDTQRRRRDALTETYATRPYTA